MAPRPIRSAAQSTTSSDITLEDQEHKFAIEADPRREKAFKIATELLATERSYVAVLHLIDQVIVHGTHVFVMFQRSAGSFCHCFHTVVELALFYRKVSMCQSWIFQQAWHLLRIFLHTG